MNSSPPPPRPRIPATAWYAIAIRTLASISRVACAGTAIWRSHGPDGGLVNALAIDPATPSTLYAGTQGGVFKSTDGAATWTLASTGLTDLTVITLAVDPLTPSTRSP